MTEETRYSLTAEQKERIKEAIEGIYNVCDYCGHRSDYPYIKANVLEILEVLISLEKVRL
jgi:hypothetical protein